MAHLIYPQGRVKCEICFLQNLATKSEFHSLELISNIQSILPLSYKK